MHRNCQVDPLRGLYTKKKLSDSTTTKKFIDKTEGAKRGDLAMLGGEERRKRWKGGEEMNDCVSGPVRVVRTEEGRVKIRFYNDSGATDRSVQQTREIERGGSRVRQRSIHRR